MAATAAARPWYNNGDESNLFGLEPNFGCCTANLHQGWPKFTASLWYATNDDGLAAISYAPCKVRTAIDGVPVRLSVGGGYPFAETVEIEVAVKRPIEFPLYLRSAVLGEAAGHPSAGGRNHDREGRPKPPASAAAGRPATL